MWPRLYLLPVTEFRWETASARSLTILWLRHDRRRRISSLHEVNSLLSDQSLRGHPSICIENMPADKAQLPHAKECRWNTEFGFDNSSYLDSASTQSQNSRQASSRAIAALPPKTAGCSSTMRYDFCSHHP